MRKTYFLLAMLFSLALSDLSAQYPGADNGIAARRSFINYAYPNLDAADDLFQSSDYNGGAELEYLRSLNQYLGLSFPLKIDRVNLPVDNVNFSTNDMVGSLDALLHLKYCKKDAFLYPSVFAGIGGVLEPNTEFGAAIPVGAMINARLMPHFYLSLKGEYRLGLSDYRDNIQLGVGVLFIMAPYEGEEEEVMDEVIEVPVDRPDADMDGVPDLEDDCPEVFGPAALGGCPDTDEDGVLDKDDACPEIPGSAELNGCPDSDGDGVLDQDDDCPDLAGLATANGCPDTDGDGVANADDDCPNEFGPAEANGCPDTDGDGVMNKDDRCPETPGLASNRGCPEIEEKDKETLEFAAQNVEFETASAVIKTESAPILDQIADILKRYPDYKLKISGHTDSIGSSGANQTLSEKRAKSCFDYLVNKGIPASRMSHAGYGESQPIADNRFKEGRAKNRRVNFDLYLDD